MARRVGGACVLLALALFIRAGGLCFLVPARSGTAASFGAPSERATVTRGASAGFAGFPLEGYKQLQVDRRGKLEEAIGSAKALPAYLLSFSAAGMMFLLMFFSYPFVKFFDPIRRAWMDKCNLCWARVTAFPFFTVRIVNPENLPAKDDKKAYVYISNHQSFMDIVSMYFLNRTFKWVSKASIKKIPIIGWGMALTGHVFLQREDRKSQIATIRECIAKLKDGASMFFYPEGTRSKTGQLGEFKKGAFSIAKKAGVGMVPITVMGTGDVMPPGREFKVFHTQGVNLVVHPIITAEEVQEMKDVDLMAKAESLIRSGLPESMKSEQ